METPPSPTPPAPDEDAAGPSAPTAKGRRSFRDADRTHNVLSGEVLPSLRMLMRGAALGGVVLLLLIALVSIRGVLDERVHLREQAVAEIADSWGPEQCLVGPLLRVPVRRREAVPYSHTEQGRRHEGVTRELVDHDVWLAPSKQTMDLRLEAERRYRGIYEAVVYGAVADIAAEFTIDPADFEGYEQVDWDQAEFLFAIADGRSLRARPAFTVGGQSAEVRAAAGVSGWEGALAADAKLAPGAGPETLPVSIALQLQGSSSLRAAVVADMSQLSIAGDWAHPSFQGKPLPAERELGADHFSAQWTQTEFARGFPSPYLASAEQPLPLDQLRARGVGVDLLQPIDAYRVAERSLKYGILFIVLVFATFLLFEVLSEVRLHPVQYLLVGAALVLFFLSLLALSEVLPVAVSYLLSAAACTALIGIYCHSVLRAGRRAGGVVAGLGVIYTYLYFVLRSESYALLAGTLLLFVCLSVIMLTTRQVDWNQLGRRRRG